MQDDSSIEQHISLGVRAFLPISTGANVWCSAIRFPIKLQLIG